MTEQYKAGTALVKAFSISGTTDNPAVVDISRLYNEISYYESIDSPSITITANIIDSTDLKSSIPIVGGEGVSYAFSDSVPESLEIKGRARLYKMSDRLRVKKGVESYNIFCSSNEMIFDQYTNITKRYGPKPTSNVFQDIFEEYIMPISGKKLASITPTDGNMVQTFTRVSPFTAIKYLASEAKAQSERSASLYVFFENAEGYHFRSIDSLFQSNPVYTFVYAEDQIQEGNFDKNTQQTRILSMLEESGFDMLAGVNRGEYGVSVSSYDPIAKKFSNRKYLHATDYAKTDHIGGGKDTLTDRNRILFGTHISFEKFIATNNDAANINYVVDNYPALQQNYRKRQEFITTETSIMARLKARTVKLAVNGNSLIRAGQTINIIYPPSGDRYGDKSQDELMSGKYLITACCHRLRQNGEYVTTIECTKDSYNETIQIGDF
jgi:hypothetical protein